MLPLRIQSPSDLHTQDGALPLFERSFFRPQFPGIRTPNKSLIREVVFRILSPTKNSPESGEQLSHIIFPQLLKYP
jgi:hypothetical protein